MKDRGRLTIAFAAVVAAMLMTTSCGDSTPPTEPAPGPRIAGAWTGTYSGISYSCDANANASFSEHRGEVSGSLTVNAPCGNLLSFRGTLQGNTLDGELTDFDGFHMRGRGTVSDATLEIHIEGGWFGTARMNFHR
jgi:hypothetical protein